MAEPLRRNRALLAPGDRALVAAAVVAFVAQLWAQVLWTPTGEGMDVFGHLAYIEFLTREGRAPRPGEPSVPRDIVRLREACLSNAYLCPSVYADWRVLTAAQRAERRSALVAQPAAPYVEPNYQSQHPPAYYWLMSWPYRAVRSWDLDTQVTALGLLSVALAATAVPSVHLLFSSLLPRPAASSLLFVLVWFPNLMPFLGRITNDALAFPLAAWLVATMAGAPRSRHPVRRSALLLGAGCWVKTYFLTMVPVYLVWCAVRGGGTVDRGERTARLALGDLCSGLAWLAAVVAPLVALNLAQTGHFVPLLEAQRTAGDPLASKMAALVAVDPYWFLAGLARNLFWSGYWSFVSPHYLFYLPLATPLVLAALARPRLRQVTSRLREIWLHAALLVAFFAGLWWHAALFALDAERRGLSVHSGNEGYYALVLLPSAVLVSVWPWWDGLSVRAWARALRWMAGGAIAWNLAGRLAMAIFWGGGVPVTGRERLLDAGAFAVAVGDPSSWTSWLSLPGVATGSPWLSFALLAAAVVVTAGALPARADSLPGAARTLP